MKGEEFIDYVRTYQLSKKDSATWNYLYMLPYHPNLIILILRT
jgi:hypothetical protein